MDFFAAQDLSRRNTKWLFLFYVLAIVAMIAVIYTAVAMVLGFGGGQAAPMINWEVLGAVTLFTLLVIGGGSLYKTVELQSGGEQIAASVGGVRVHPSTTNLQERRLLLSLIHI